MRIKGTNAGIKLVNHNGVTWFDSTIFFESVEQHPEQRDVVVVGGFTETDPSHMHAFRSWAGASYWIKDGKTLPLKGDRYFNFDRGHREFELHLPRQEGPARLEFTGARVYAMDGLVNWDHHPNIRIDIAADGSLTFWHYMMKGDSVPLSR